MGMYCEFHNVQENHLTLQRGRSVIHICREEPNIYPPGSPNAEETMGANSYVALCGTFSQSIHEQGYGSLWPQPHDYLQFCKRCSRAHK